MHTDSPFVSTPTQGTSPLKGGSTPVGSCRDSSHPPPSLLFSPRLILLRPLQIPLLKHSLAPPLPRSHSMAPHSSSRGLIPWLSGARRRVSLDQSMSPWESLGDSVCVSSPLRLCIVMLKRGLPMTSTSSLPGTSM